MENLLKKGIAESVLTRCGFKKAFSNIFTKVGNMCKFEVSLDPVSEKGLLRIEHDGKISNKIYNDYSHLVFQIEKIVVTLLNKYLNEI